MRNVVMALAAAMVLAGCSRDTGVPQEKASAIASRAEPNPVEIIRPLYERYTTQGAPAPALHEAAPWTDTLREAIEATLARSRAINEPIIDFDPLIDAQDVQLRDLRVETVQRPADGRAIVEARFSNMGRPTILYYDMRIVDGAWRIDNVRTTSWNLRELTRQAPALDPKAPDQPRNAVEAQNTEGAKPEAKP